MTKQTHFLSYKPQLLVLLLVLLYQCGEYGAIWIFGLYDWLPARLHEILQ